MSMILQFTCANFFELELELHIVDHLISKNQKKLKNSMSISYLNEVHYNITIDTTNGSGTKEIMYNGIPEEGILLFILFYFNLDEGT